MRPAHCEQVRVPEMLAANGIHCWPIIDVGQKQGALDLTDRAYRQPEPPQRTENLMIPVALSYDVLGWQQRR